MPCNCNWQYHYNRPKESVRLCRVWRTAYATNYYTPTLYWLILDIRQCFLSEGFPVLGPGMLPATHLRHLYTTLPSLVFCLKARLADLRSKRETLPFHPQSSRILQDTIRRGFSLHNTDLPAYWNNAFPMTLGRSPPAAYVTWTVGKNCRPGKRETPSTYT